MNLEAEGNLWLGFILRVIRSIVGKILLHTFSCHLTHSVSLSLPLCLLPIPLQIMGHDY